MAESTIGSNFIATFNADVVNAIQDRTLQRVFHDALFPRLLFRGEAAPEMWPTNLGQNQTFTRTGLIRPTTRTLQANNDPIPQQYGFEQWEATAQQWGASIDTHMPTNYVTLASVYLRNMHQLGLHAGQSLNRVVRDKLFNAYSAGNTTVGTAGAATTSVTVRSLNGFTRKLQNGRPAQVSATNSLTVTIITGGTPAQHVVTAATPTEVGNEIGPGVLTVTAATTTAVNDPVIAENASEVINSGGATSIEGIGSGDVFTMADVRDAITQLRNNNVPVHEDGNYHCHLDPTSENQIFGDNEFQRLNNSLPDYLHYREFALAHMLNCTFYRNTESPVAATVDQDPRYGGTFAPRLQNAQTTPVAIHRPIFTGRDVIEEKYLDESKYISEAGIIGKIGEFSVQNNGMQVMTERIRLILRAPLDRLQQVTSASWSFSGDWPIPTDAAVETSSADFKRAVIVQHGE